MRRGSHRVGHAVIAVFLFLLARRRAVGAGGLTGCLMDILILGVFPVIWETMNSPAHVAFIGHGGGRHRTAVVWGRFQSVIARGNPSSQ